MITPTGRFELWLRRTSGRLSCLARFDREDDAREWFALHAPDDVGSAWIFDGLTRHKQHIA